MLPDQRPHVTADKSLPANHDGFAGIAGAGIDANVRSVCVVLVLERRGSLTTEIRACSRDGQRVEGTDGDLVVSSQLWSMDDLASTRRCHHA